jgi:hypothetical protein
MTDLHFISKTIPIPIYGATFSIVFTNDKEKLYKYLNKEFEINDIYGTTYWSYKNKKQNIVVVYNFWNDTTDITHGVISHECLHACYMLSESRNLNISYDNDENVAYMLQWFVNQVYNFIKENKINV